MTTSVTRRSADDAAQEPGRRDLRSLARRDLAWRDNEVVWGVRIERAPDREEVVAALDRWFAANPGSHFLRYLDADAGEWRRPRPGEVAALVAQLVRSSPEDADTMDLQSRVEDAQTEALDALPFRITLGRGWAILRFSHALGDAGTVWPLFMGLIAPHRLAELVPTGADAGHPLAAALWNTFGKNPGRLVRAVRTERTPMPVAALGTQRFRAGGTQLVASRSAPGFRRELARFRKATAPDASMVGLLVARAMTAAGAGGLRPFPGVGMVADVRRHLPGRRYGSGNFTAGAYLAVPDPRDPVQVTEAIGEYTASARPLLTLTLMAARARRGPRLEPIWAEPAAGADCLVSFSHVGRLPWPVEPPERGLVLGRPIGQRGLAIVTFEIGAFLYASVSFHESQVPRSVAEAVSGVLVELG